MLPKLLPASSHPRQGCATARTAITSPTRELHQAGKSSHPAIPESKFAAQSPRPTLKPSASLEFVGSAGPSTLQSPPTALRLRVLARSTLPRLLVTNPGLLFQLKKIHSNFQSLSGWRWLGLAHSRSPPQPRLTRIFAHHKGRVNETHVTYIKRVDGKKQGPERVRALLTFNERYRFNIGAALCSATIFLALSASALA